MNKDSNNRVELYFEINNVDMYFSRLKGRQIEFLHEMHEEPWGQRDFRFFDPDNNHVEIGAAMNSVSRRLYNSGMNIEEVVAKTGMSEERILGIINLN